MSRWVVNNIFAMGVLSEKNYWLKMGRETHSNINYLSAWSYSWITVCERSITQPKLIGTNHTSFLLILTWFALFSIKFHRYNQMWASEWACLLKPFFFFGIRPLCCWKSDFCRWYIVRGFKLSVKAFRANPHIRKDEVSWKA